jgi:hypothetical protein
MRQEGVVLFKNRKTAMTKFKTADRDSKNQLDDSQLDAVVGGAMLDALSPQLELASTPVGGWSFKDVFAKPTLGRY